MATKQNNYITAELEFAEAQLQGWKQYIEANPINTLVDRWGKKEMPKGGFAWVVTATAEQQIKCVQDTLTKYLQLLEVVDRLREKENTKVEVRGKTELGVMADEYLKQRK
jgi:hypothetical protein